MAAGSLQVVPVHNASDAIALETAELLSSEWKRSIEARLYSLRQSTDGLPACLAGSLDDRVVAHARVSRITLPSTNVAILIESVVVHASLRGQGIGRRIMEAAEAYAARAVPDATAFYLSTPDMQAFYLRLGYTECEQPTFAKAGALFEAMHSEQPTVAVAEEPAVSTPEEPVVGRTAAPPPPPPPPLAPALPQEPPHQWFTKTI